MAEYVAYTVVAAALASIARKLTEADTEEPLVDEKPTTLASQGQYLPVLVGRRRVGPAVAWAGGRRSATESAAGGKGFQAGGDDQTVWFEKGWHFIGFGPAQRLYRIWENGEVIWNNGGDLSGIGPDTDAGGTSFNTVDNLDTFRVFWGEQDQNIAASFLSTEIGIGSRFPFGIWVEWDEKRLGGFPRWGSIEYEFEVWPFRPSIVTPADNGNAVDSANWGTYPWQLTQSDGIFRGLGFGADADIGTIRNISQVPNLKLAGDLTSSFVVGETMQITGHQQNTQMNGAHTIGSSSYNGSELDYIRDPGGVEYRNSVTSTDYINDFTFTVSGIGFSRAKVALGSGGGAPTVFPANINNPAGDLWKLVGGSSGGSGPNRLERTLSAPNSPARGFEMKIRLYVWNPFSEAGGNVTIGLKGNTNEKYATFAFTSDIDTSPFVLTSDGVTYKHFALSPAGWHSINFDYILGEGPDYIERLENLSWYVEWPESGNNVLWIGTDREQYSDWDSGTNYRVFDVVKYVDGVEKYFYALQAHSAVAPTNATFWSEVGPTSDDWGRTIFWDMGFPYTGITTVVPQLTLQAGTWASGHEGVASGGVTAGTGPAEINPAHILYQLLFEKYPHGAGLDISKFDIDSLEQIGIKAGPGNEELASHVLFQDGESFSNAIGAVLTDLGCFISWDVNKGQYVFKLVRQEDPQFVATISEDLVIPKAPEISAQIGPRQKTRLVFGFPDEERKYRTSPVSIDEDGRASIRDNQSSQKVPLTLPTKIEVASKIAQRRSSEALSINNKYTLTLNRDARSLVPGDVRKFDASTGINETLRIIGVELDPLSGSVKVDASTDTYSLDDTLTAALPVPPSGGGGIPAPEPAASWDVLEVPPMLSEGHMALWVPYRKFQGGGRVALWGSTDDSSYSRMVQGVTLAAEGTLRYPWTDPFYVSSESPEIQSTSFGSLTPLSESQWRTGRQTAVVISNQGVEYIFVKSVRLEDVNVYVFENIIRGRYGSKILPHDAGARIYVVDVRKIRAVRDPLIANKAAFYVKPQEPGVSLSEVASKSIVVEGKGIRPIDPWGLNQGDGRFAFQNGQDVILSWKYARRDGLRLETAAGYQTPGNKVRFAGPEEDFRVRIYKKSSGALLRQIDVSAPVYKYTWADLISDMGSPDDITVEVRSTHPEYGTPEQVDIIYYA